MRRQQHQYDNVMVGIALGAIIPVLGYLLVDGLFNAAIDADLMPPARGSGIDRRMRTFMLLALCCNLVPFTIFKNKRFDQSMRGMIIPTMIYVFFWLYKFSGGLF